MLLVSRKPHHDPEPTSMEIFDRIPQAVMSMPKGYSDGRPREPFLFPSVSLASLDAAESILQFELPPFLRAIYSKLGNGGKNLGHIMGIVVDGLLENRH